MCRVVQIKLNQSVQENVHMITYQKSVFKRYHSYKHISQFLPTRHTHTYPFNGPFSGTTHVSRHQKGKTNLDFTEARESEWQWHQLGHMQVCTSLQTDNHASTSPLSFLQAGRPSCRPTNSVKALKAFFTYKVAAKINWHRYQRLTATLCMHRRLAVVPRVHGHGSSAGRIEGEVRIVTESSVRCGRRLFS